MWFKCYWETELWVPSDVRCSWGSTNQHPWCPKGAIAPSPLSAVSTTWSCQDLGDNKADLYKGWWKTEVDWSWLKLIEVDWSWYDILQETIDFPIKYGAFHWWTNPLMIVNLCEFRGLSGLSKRDCLGRTRRTKWATHAGQDIKDETLKVLHPNKKLDIIGSPFGWWTDEPINPAFKTRLCLRADLAFTGDGKHLVSLSSMPDCTVPSLDPVRWSTTTCA